MKGVLIIDSISSSSSTLFFVPLTIAMTAPGEVPAINEAKSKDNKMFPGLNMKSVAIVRITIVRIRNIAVSLSA